MSYTSDFHRDLISRVCGSPSAGRLAVVALTAATTLLVSTSLTAQEATSDQPGVIERGDDQSDDNENQDDQSQNQGSEQQNQQGGEASNNDNQNARQQNQSDQSNQQQSDQQPSGRQVNPERPSTSEQYNLPSNFDPDFRPKQTPGNSRVTIDFRQASLEEVVKFFSGVTQRNFIVSDSLQANKTITIISPQDVTLEEAYRAFLAALEMNGLTVVRSGEFWKIIQAKQAVSEPGRTYGEGDYLPNEARMVTAILPIENADVEKIREVVSKFTTDAATLITYENTLIVSENSANLRRIRNIIDRLDRQDTGEQVFVYDVQYAEAQSVADKLKEVFQSESGGGGGRGRGDEGGDTQTLDVDVSQLIADERTNQLIIVTTKRSFEKVEEMIKLLDVPTGGGGGQVHVKFLEYAAADELASTLSNLASSLQQDQDGPGARIRRRARQQQQQEGGGGGDVAALLQGEVQITAYEPNNALIITAAPKDYMALEDVIDTLDRPRKQVYVEAVIMEIGLDTDRNLGLGLNASTSQDLSGVIPDSALEQGIIENDQGVILGQSNFSGNLGSALQGTGGALGLVGPSLNIPGIDLSIPAFALLLEASQTSDSVNILSTPSLLTLDNEEAEIVVGERRPFLTSAGIGGGLGGGGLGGALGGLTGQGGQQGQSGLGGLGGAAGLLGGLGGLGQQIQYQDVGITLNITPQINESRYVRLEVNQEVSDIAGAGSDQGLTPTQTRRNAQTVVLAKDQSTVVIGGLMREVENETTQKTPFLGDIPIIGAIFRKTSTITTKQNLVLLLTPYIIESESDMQKVYERKLEERRELLELFARDDQGYDKSINFDKKSGLVDRMRDQIQQQRQQQQAREAAEEAFDQNGPQYRILGNDEAPPGQNQQQRDDSSSGGPGQFSPESDTRSPSSPDSTSSGNTANDTTNRTQEEPATSDDNAENDDQESSESDSGE